MNIKKELFIERIFNAPREKVWDMWTQKENISKWFNTDDASTIKVVSFDVQVGGGFRLAFVDENGVATPGEYTAVYTEVEPPERLTFRVTDYSVTDDPKGIVVTFSVHLVETDEGTLMTFTSDTPDETYEKFSPNELLIGYDGAVTAWSACFDSIAELLSKN